MSLNNEEDIFDNTEIKQETNISFNEEELNFNEYDLNCSNECNSNNSFILNDNNEDKNNNHINNNEDINIDIKIKKKLTKEDLTTIPLTIFDCIFCANENITFTHFINEKLIEKYLYCTSPFDILILNNIIVKKKFKDKNKNNNNNSNDNINKKIIKKIKEKILYNSEYLFKFNNKKESLLYLKKKCIGLNENNNEKESENNNNNNKNENIEEIKESKLQKLINQNLSRKIKFEDIDFESEPFDIWNCNFSDKEDLINNNSNNKNNNNLCNNLTINFNTLKLKEKLCSSFNDLECSYSTLISSPSSKDNKSYKEKNKNLSFLFYLK